MGDTIGGSSAKTGGNAVGNDLHSETTGKHGTVGSVATNIWSVYRWKFLGGGRTQEVVMVDPRGGREEN